MKGVLLVLLVLVVGQVHADSLPECDDHGSPMSIDNDRVARLKHSTQNGYHDRAFIQGTLSKVYPDKTGHSHAELTMSGSSETIELIYNEDFGSGPQLHVGQSVIACGDYITSYQYDGHYQPSPDGALVHWLHRSPRPSHDSGFMIVDGTVVGL